jgi:hypothetical protein
MGDWALALGLVFAVNLLPAFGPPTWAVLIWLEFSLRLDPVPLVLLGALAAALGRFCLAHGARRLRGRFSKERLDNLDAARELVTGGRGRAAAGLGLFAVSPLPSAQLFVAAGLVDVALGRLTAAFFAGRLVSYSLYVGAATAASASLGTVVTDSLTSPLGIALQVLMLGGLVALVRIDWARLLGRHAAPGSVVHRGPSVAKPR